jgi:hypothetical protein
MFVSHGRRQSYHIAMRCEPQGPRRSLDMRSSRLSDRCRIADPDIELHTREHNLARSRTNQRIHNRIDQRDPVLSRKEGAWSSPTRHAVCSKDAKACATQ